MSKLKYVLLVVIVVVGVGVTLRDHVAGLLSQLPDREQLISDIHSLIPISQIKKEILVASPLRAYFENNESILTREGVLQWTNEYRMQGGSPGLFESVVLDSAADAKMQDMFAKQYFAHTSPDGVGPSHWDEQVHYEYIVIGENLALGNYANDKDLVDAWMASPGHRENIINPRFQEIGIAVGKGMFEGRSTWIAVQTFAKPASSCPRAGAVLKTRIDSQERQLDHWQSDLELLASTVKTTDRQNIEAYNAVVEKYNALASRYNELVEQTKRLIATYNKEINSYNTCAQS